VNVDDNLVHKSMIFAVLGGLLAFGLVVVSASLWMALDIIRDAVKRW